MVPGAGDAYVGEASYRLFGPFLSRLKEVEAYEEHAGVVEPLCAVDR